MTTDEMIFELDGMAHHTDTGIRRVALREEGGHAPCINPLGSRNRKRDLSAIVGLHAKTVAVFYVLENVALAQEDFFDHQADILSSADEAGPIRLHTLGRGGGAVDFRDVENCINTWLPVHSENQKNNTEFRLKVSQVQLPTN